MASQPSTRLLQLLASVASPATIETPGSLDRYAATSDDLASFAMEGETEESMGCRRRQRV